METNKNDRRHQDDVRREIAPGNQNEDHIGINKDVSGNDRTDEAREERKFHQSHGNRKYESYSNHSSADDQPMTNTGPGNM